MKDVMVTSMVSEQAARRSMLKRYILMAGLMILLALTSAAWIKYRNDASLDVNENLDYCVDQARKTLLQIPGGALMPRSIDHDKSSWRYVPIEDWTSGFWPGTLWYIYEATGDEQWRVEADRYTRMLAPLSQRRAMDHDLGFQMFSSFGNGYRLIQDTSYKEIILRTADTLATLYNEAAGTIRSWPGMVKEKGWPHNTIIDNMINLELLFWASKHGGDKSLYDIAVRHAETTMKNHFRPDYTSYHVVLYDTLTGEKIKGMTHQGFSDESMWARGQAWAIYGFTMVYRETKDRRFLDFVQAVIDVYLSHLPADDIPYWDFNAPRIPHETRDASAAAITASALLELARYVPKSKSDYYQEKATRMLYILSSEQYQSRNRNASFLLHSTGHRPNGTEVDASIIYADYYYIEALLRLKVLQ
ncbi:glycoside hydrolase family 88 protein [Ohtaekwangia koreensis]|nr:glycoside hydrolase family 88 protein [Ohtaekwangia koreensis]